MGLCWRTLFCTWPACIILIHMANPLQSCYRVPECIARETTDRLVDSALRLNNCIQYANIAGFANTAAGVVHFALFRNEASVLVHESEMYFYAIHLCI